MRLNLKSLKQNQNGESTRESNNQLEQKILDLKSEIKQITEKYKQRINEKKHSLEVKIADYTSVVSRLLFEIILRIKKVFKVLFLFDSFVFTRKLK